MDSPRRHVLDDDDRPIGRVLSRRELLALLGAGGATLVTAAYAPHVLAQGASPSPVATSGGATSSPGMAVPACVVSPELTEGPYFVDGALERSDIRSDPATGTVKEGLPLAIRFMVSRLDGVACLPLAGALVDVWHCDALGVYSGVQDRSFDTSGEQWLRGHQRTDAEGTASFQTIYPGWYSGRAVHIHFKIRTDPDEAVGLEFTSQLFFDDDTSRSVFTLAPYAEKGPQDMPNSEDGIYRQGGELLTLALVASDEGYTADVPIGVLVG
jgi:protocatechuate 3,4-dioxygenase beta subunit